MEFKEFTVALPPNYTSSSSTLSHNKISREVKIIQVPTQISEELFLIVVGINQYENNIHIIHYRIRIIIPKEEISNITDFLKRFAVEVIENTNKPDTIAFDGSNLNEDPLNIESYYNLCKEAREKKIIFLDEHMLHIQNKPFCMNNGILNAQLELRGFIYKEGETQYFENFSDDEDNDLYVSNYDIMMELGGENYEYPSSQWKHERNKKIARKRIIERRKAALEVKLVPKGPDEEPWDLELQLIKSSNSSSGRKMLSVDECCDEENQTLKKAKASSVEEKMLL
jgi:hypothetical protein